MNKETEFFKVVTLSSLKKMELKYYGAGKKLKVGDCIISGLTMGYSNLRGAAPSKHFTDDILNLQLFVLDKNQNMLYQLYDKR